jgi:hypothetical protein
MDRSAALTQLLLARLERISVDSRWAHQASGVRGALLRALERPIEARSVPGSELNGLMELGFKILKRAAEEKIR